MGKRGPRPSGRLAVVNFDKNKKPNPPAGMSARARNLFKKIVGDNPSGTFDAESVALLRAFCEADNQHYLATKKLQEEGAVVNMPVGVENEEIVYKKKRNPWFDIQKESSSGMSSLSTKLRNKEIHTGQKKQADSNPRKGLMFGG